MGELFFDHLKSIFYQIHKYLILNNIVRWHHFHMKLMLQIRLPLSISLCINRNARPNNNQLITYYQRVSYLLRIQKYPVNNTYNKGNHTVKPQHKKIRQKSSRDFVFFYVTALVHVFIQQIFLGNCNC